MHDERARLFVALELPQEVREALVLWRERALGRSAELRALSADALHVTLCFLGWRAAGEIDAIAAACRVLAAEPAPRLVLGAARWLPPRRPRVLAIELLDAAGALTRAQALLSETLAAGGWYEPERRPYLAHVTVARLARDGRAPRRELPPLRSLQFEASRVSLFRSRLLRSGARYEALATLDLR